MSLPRVLATAAGLLALATAALAQPALPTDHPLALTAAEEARIDSLVGAMTLREKAGQMNQYTSFYDVTGPAPEEGTAAARFAQIAAGEVGSMLNVTGAAETRKLQEEAMRSRLGIPLLFAFDVIHGFETQFPVPLAEAATWSPELVRAAARWAATEASAHGLHWTFAPMVDVSPDARWGRIAEGAGEDPYLGSVMAAARVRGFQGDDLGDATTIAACAKHLAGYGYARGGRDYNAVDVSDYTLYNEILPPFRAAAEAGAATFMNSFNTLGGVPATGSAFLQREWLKDSLDWPGFIVSDWNSIGEMIAHGVAADRAAAAELAVEAGSDMDMETGAYLGELVALVEAGAVDEARLDDAVRRILRVKTALGLFADPYRYCDTTREASAPRDPAMRAAAIETAARSAVLLQNDTTAAGTPVLPLDVRGGRTIAVIGDLAADTDSPLGTWSLAAPRNSAVSLVAAIREAMGADSAALTYNAGPPTLEPGSRSEFLFELRPNRTDTAGIGAAVAAARAADVVLLALGEPGFMSGEARSRTRLDLPGVQRQLYEAVVAARPDAAVVLYTGRPLDLSPLAQNGTAALVAWQPGTYGNHGIAEVLLGGREPAGRLPVSFPRSVGQEPLTYRDYATGRPEGPGSRAAEVVFYSHYMDEEAGALYPFGHGLGYTSFTLGAPVARRVDGDGGKGSTFEVSATITNAGQRPGYCTAQLYVRDPSATRARPVRELRAFRNLDLRPGASEEVTFDVGAEELKFWTPEEGWHVEPGVYRVYVGLSSAELGEGVEVIIE